MKRGLLVVGHGSRVKAGNSQFLTLASLLGDEHPEWAVQPCFLGHCVPDVKAGVDQLAAYGASSVVIQPLLLFAAGHAKRELPEHMREAQRRHPGITFRLGSPVGGHPSLLRICVQSLARAEAVGPPRDRSETVVLLVGRGASDAEAVGQFVEVARRLHASGFYRSVEIAFVALSSPSVAEGVRKCLSLGARRVILLPYFLFTGVLMDRMRATVADWSRVRPDVQFLLAGAEGIGNGNGMLQLLEEQAKELFSGI